MEIDKHDKVRSILSETIATFIRNEASSDPLITVTDIFIAPNYRTARVLITTIPNDKEADALIFLKRKGSELRSYIKKHARLKYIPHIDFDIDRGERHRQHIDELSREIEKGKE